MIKSLKKRFIQTFWVLAGVACMVLFGAAVTKKDHKLISDVKIEIVGAEEHLFIDEKEVNGILNSNGSIRNKKIAALDLRALEQGLEKYIWVSNAELYIDNNQVLHVEIEERQPIARVFTQQGTSFYLDSAGLRLPLSPNLSARVPVFTSFPNDKAVLASPDSILLKDVVNYAKFIVQDSFWMAQVGQIDITPQATFEMIPSFGNHTVVLGDAEDIEGKFKRLFTFYKNAWLQNGFDKYEQLNVAYNNQIIALKKGATQATIDSALAIKVLHNIIQQELKDSANFYAVKDQRISAVKIDTNQNKLIQNKIVNKPLSLKRTQIEIKKSSGRSLSNSNN